MPLTRPLTLLHYKGLFIELRNSLSLVNLDLKMLFHLQKPLNENESIHLENQLYNC